MEAVMKKEVNGYPVITPEILLEQWQAQRRLTRKVIVTYPEEKIFDYSIGGMRPFSGLLFEMIALADYGISGIVSRQWETVENSPTHGVQLSSDSKDAILQKWDEVTEKINKLWPQISNERFHEVDMAFGMYEGETYSTILYFIHNEIHHRAQAYVYLRSLGIEPPAFWDTN